MRRNNNERICLGLPQNTNSQNVLDIQHAMPAFAVPKSLPIRPILGQGHKSKFKVTGKVVGATSKSSSDSFTTGAVVK